MQMRRTVGRMEEKKEKSKNRKKFFFKAFLAAAVAVIIGMFSAFFVTFCPVWNEPTYNFFLFTHERYMPEGELLYKHKYADSKEVSILSKDGKSKLNAQLHLRKGATKIAILSHGKGMNIFSDRFKTECLLDAGVSVLAYDYRGYGLSEGSATIDGVVDDLISSYNWVLKNTKYKPEQIILYGESLGTGVSGEAARRVKCGGVVLESSFTSLEDIAKHSIPVLNIYPSFLFPQPGLDNMAMVKGEHPPLLLVAGVLDAEIPVDHTKRLYAKASEPKQMLLLKNSGHIFFQKDRDEFVSALKQFCSEN